MGVLFVVYAIMRLAIGWEFRQLPPKEPLWDSQEPGSAFDAAKLSGRVEQLRHDGHAGAAQKPASFKKPLLVEEKRKQMQTLPFFQTPPTPPEPPEHEDGVGLLLI